VCGLDDFFGDLAYVVEELVGSADLLRLILFRVCVHTDRDFSSADSG